MSLSKAVAKMRYGYHLSVIEINNVLNQLGLREDNRAENIAKNHFTTIVTDILPRLGKDVSEFFKDRDES